MVGDIKKGAVTMSDNENVRVIKKDGLEYLSLDNIIANDYNEYEMTDIDDLAGNIKVLGLIEPLSVIGPDDNGKYTLISGERRYRAMLKLRDEAPILYSLVPCHIVGPSDMDDKEQRILIETANVETRSINKSKAMLKVVEILHEMEDDGNIEHKEITKKAKEYLSVSARYSRIVNQVFEKASDDVKELVKEGSVGMVNAAAITSLKEDKQKEVIDTIKDGGNVKESIQKARNEQVIEQLEEEGTDVDVFNDMNDEDFEKFMRTATTTDLVNAINDRAKETESIQNELDSTGVLPDLKEQQEDSDRKTSDHEAETVIRWCSRMKEVEFYSETEERALEAVKGLYEYIYC